MKITYHVWDKQSNKRIPAGKAH